MQTLIRGGDLAPWLLPLNPSSPWSGSHRAVGPLDAASIPNCPGLSRRKAGTLRGWRGRREELWHGNTRASRSTAKPRDTLSCASQSQYHAPHCVLDPLMSCTPPRMLRAFFSPSWGQRPRLTPCPVPPHAFHGPAQARKPLGAALGCGTRTRPVSGGSRWTDGLGGSLRAVGSHRAGMSWRVQFVGCWSPLPARHRRHGPNPPVGPGAGLYRQGRGRTGEQPGRAERQRQPGLRHWDWERDRHRDVPQDGSEGESSGIGTVRGAPRAAREPRSRSRTARWVRPAPGRRRSERRTPCDRDEAMAGSLTGPGAAPVGHSSPDEGGPCWWLCWGCRGPKARGSEGRGLRAALLRERRAPSSNLVLMTGDTA